MSSEIQPPVGTPLAIGGCVGRVVRVFNGGFAVQFVEAQRLGDLARLVSRESARRTGRQNDIAEEAPA